jgi:hypothetical protein
MTDEEMHIMCIDLTNAITRLTNAMHEAASSLSLLSLEEEEERG